MKAYGIPRNNDVGSPDLADIQKYGLKSSISRIMKYGSIKNSFRSSSRKRRIRRFWKKKIRREWKIMIKLLQKE